MTPISEVISALDGSASQQRGCRKFAGPLPIPCSFSLVPKYTSSLPLGKAGQFRRIALDPPPGSGSCVPKPLPAAECIGILAEAHALREFLQQLRIASAEHYVIGNQRGLQLGDDIIHVDPPFLFPEPLQSAEADVVFE